MVEIKVFLMKAKLKYQLFQWEEYVYGAQSVNEKRLLHETMFMLIEWWTLIVKNG